ncbi:MAG: hypothetical protein U0271_02000 [Polyangiaceae bacterium]
MLGLIRFVGAVAILVGVSVLAVSCSSIGHPGDACQLPEDCISQRCEVGECHCTNANYFGSCDEDSDCCSGVCNSDGSCACGGAGIECNTPGGCCDSDCIEGRCCAHQGEGCGADTPCCTGDCDGGTCGCGHSEARCQEEADCCDGFACVAGGCCAELATPCTTAGECCPPDDPYSYATCDNGVCGVAQVQCGGHLGDLCLHDAECCSQTCTLGFCG